MAYHVIRDTDRQHCRAYWSDADQTYGELEHATIYDDEALALLDMTLFKGAASSMRLPSALQPVTPLRVEHLADIAIASATLTRRRPFIPEAEIGINIAASAIEALLASDGGPIDAAALSEAANDEIIAAQRIADVAYLLHREFGLDVDEDTRIDDVVASHRTDAAVLRALSSGLGVDANGLNLATIATVADLARSIASLPFDDIHPDAD